MKQTTVSQHSMFTTNLTAFATLVRKEVVRFLRIWMQTLLPPVITQALYFIIFGAFIGSQIGEVQGVPYISYIVPGLIMMSVIVNSFSNVVSSFFGSKFMRNVEEILVSPAAHWVILAGFCAGGVLRGILVGAIVFAVSFFFVHVPILHLGIVVAFVFLTAVLFSLGGFMNGLFAKKFDDVAIFPTFVLTPLTYFGGVFYSVKDLPDVWQTLSWFNPMLYMIDGFRYGFFGVSDVNVWVSLMALTGFTVVMAVLALWMLYRGAGLKH